jgi:hypothetical protein
LGGVWWVHLTFELDAENKIFIFFALSDNSKFKCQ